MAKRHNMCCDKRHSCTPIKTIFCLAYIITYIMTFRLPFFWLTLYISIFSLLCRNIKRTHKARYIELHVGKSEYIYYMIISTQHKQAILICMYICTMDLFISMYLIQC